jgi:hypothetical protein
LNERKRAKHVSATSAITRDVATAGANGGSIRSDFRVLSTLMGVCGCSRHGYGRHSARAVPLGADPM